MATQLTMFKGVQGNKLGESLPKPENKEQSSETVSIPDSDEANDLEKLVEEMEPGELSPELIDISPVVDHSGESLPIEQLLPPPSPPIQIVSQLPARESHPNPYDSASNVNDQTEESKAINVLRWIVALPASILGGLVAYSIVVFLNRITMARYLDPDSFMAEIFVQGIGNTIMGAAFVYIAIYTAPSYKKQTSIVMPGIALLITGMFLFPAIMTSNYWAIFSTVFINVGSIAMAYGVFRKEKENEEFAQQSH